MIALEAAQGAARAHLSVLRRRADGRGLGPALPGEESSIIARPSSLRETRVAW
jgi:hypothetical protein